MDFPEGEDGALEYDAGEGDDIRTLWRFALYTSLGLSLKALRTK
jgi:hypothetical protein